MLTILRVRVKDIPVNPMLLRYQNYDIIVDSNVLLLLFFCFFFLQKKS